MNALRHLPFVALLLFGCHWAKEPVDLVIRNAHIVCLDGAGTQAQAMAIHEGQIVALGKEHEILNAYRGETVEDPRLAVYWNRVSPDSFAPTEAE